MGNEHLTLFIAFGSGLVSFFAPCLLPLIPSYLSVISGFTFKDLYGLNFEKIRGRVFISSLFFVAGFVSFFSLMGATATLFGHLLREQFLFFTRLGGFFLIFLGLVQLGVVKFEFLRFDFAWRVQKRLASLGYLTAFLVGIISGLVWIPCIGQILAPILFLASQKETVGQGITLLFTFSFGLASPFLILGLCFPTIFNLIKNYRSFLHFLSIFAGVILIAFGLILILNQYQILVNKFFGFTYPLLEK